VSETGILLFDIRGLELYYSEEVNNDKKNAVFAILVEQKK
jgi:hypothetical protein